MDQQDLLAVESQLGGADEVDLLEDDQRRERQDEAGRELEDHEAPSQAAAARPALDMSSKHGHRLKRRHEERRIGSGKKRDQEDRDGEAGEQNGEAVRILKEFGIDQEKIYRALRDIRGGQRVTDPRAESKYRA
jgi:vacuolar-type H+-ATPase subunit I/STV1